MSTTVDSRVVEMRFDNKQFESNVQTSMSTLDKLKQKLNLSGASKGLEGLNSAAKRVDMSGLGSGVEAVTAKFSALQVMGVTALANITNSAVNAGKNMVSALTIDPIKDGFAEYETQMNAVQTILANTQKEGTTVKTVNAALDELNHYADKTIYNFTEMTRNIGTFTAAGVKLDTSVSAIQGIANLAAVSGSSSQQASTAMYQLSQAIASGTVKLMDWNSVVNAGMGGQVFQDALVRTSEHLKTGAKDAISAKGSFRESLQTGWLTTEVLTQTLDQFATAADTQEEYEAAVKKFVDQGYSKKQAKEMADMARTAGQAATKVKTFSQLIDTVKEALGSGWTETWRTIVGDFEEAKTLWTDVSDALSGMINKSADARNKVVKGWAKLGGRTALIESFKNVFTALGKVITPIGKAFREIFPRTTAKQLYEITKSVRDFTKGLIVSDSTAKKIHSTFKGVFSVFRVGLDVVKTLGKGLFSLVGNFKGLGSGILTVTGHIGDFLSKLSSSIKDVNLFNKSFTSGFDTKVFDGLIGFFEGLWNVITKVGSSVVKTFGSIGQAISDAFGKGDIFEVLNSGLIAGILLTIKKFTGTIDDAFDGFGGVLENVTGILDDVRGCFEAYQKQLKAGTLLKIASAIAILAGSLYLISMIDPDSMNQAITAITVLFTELVAAMAAMNKWGGSSKLFDTTAVKMVGMSAAILILATALKSLSGLNWDQLAVGLTGVSVLLWELVAASVIMSATGSKMIKGSLGLIALAGAMKILASACKDFSKMSWEDIGKGLAAIGGLLLEISAFTNIASYAKHITRTGLSMMLIAASLKILASVMADFGGMDWNAIGKGLAGMGGALAELAIAMRLIPNGAVFKATGLVIAAAALKVIASALNDVSGMSQENVGKSLIAIGVALGELAIGLNLMKGTLGGSAALLVAASSLAILVPVIKTLGNMSWTEIGKGLLTLAGAFTVIGVAGALLGPIVPTILGLSAAFALLGVGMAGIGVGLIGISAGITALAAAGAAGATAIVAALTVIVTGILDLVPTIAKIIGNGIVEIAKVLGEAAPQLAESFLKLISESLKALAEYAPQIADSLFELLIGVINSLAVHTPELIQAFVNLLAKVFEGVADALNGIDTANLLKGILAVGMMSALAYALAGITAIIPSAMAGLLGVGVLIAEMSAILAAIGGLAQIPGLSWLVEEGGNFLQKIGTAIGQFIGGIAGGVAKGFSSSLPEIGTNLSSFMENLKPFIEGAKTIDSTAIEGVDNIVSLLSKITGQNILEAISSFITGTSSMETFKTQLDAFGDAIVSFSQKVSGNIDPGAIEAAANVGKLLTELQSTVEPDNGLFQLLAGEKNLGELGTQAVAFADSIKMVAQSLSGMNETDFTNVEGLANAGQALADLQSMVEPANGLLQALSGSQDLSTLGSQAIAFVNSMKKIAETISTMGETDFSNIESLANAGQALAALQSAVAPANGLLQALAGSQDLSTLGYQASMFAYSIKSVAQAISGMGETDFTNLESLANVGQAFAALQSAVAPANGLLQALSGSQDLSTLGYQVIAFAGSIKMVAQAISGLKEADFTNIENLANAGQALAALQSSVEPANGLMQVLTGSGDLSTLGIQASSFAKSLSMISKSLTGDNAIDMSAVETATQAGKMLSALQKALPEEHWFDGKMNLQQFGTKISAFGTAMKSFGDSVAEVDTSKISLSITLGRRIAAFAKSIVDLDTSGISNFKKVKGIGDAIKGYNNKVSDIDTGVVSKSITAANRLKSFVRGLSGFDSSSISNFKVGSLGKAIKSYSDSVSGMNVSTVSSSITAANRLKSFISSLAGLDTSGVGKFKSAISELGKTNVSQVASAFSKGTSKITSAGRNLTKALSSGIKSNSSSVKSAATSMVSSMQKSITSKASSFTSSGVKLATSFVKGITSKKGAAVSAAKALATSAASASKTGYGTMYANGAYLGAGLISGVRGKISAAYAAGYALGQAAVRGEKDGQHSNSPSKDTIKAGKWLGEGLVIGTQSMTKKVYKAGHSMGQAATQSISSAISSAANLVDKVAESTPTIRPVVDLSDVKDQASTIGSLFSNPMVSPTSNIRAIKTLMDENSQNGNIDDVVSAINKLRKDMGSVGNTYNNINGVTYDDGSGISDAVETIFRAARVERRR